MAQTRLISKMQEHLGGFAAFSKIGEGSDSVVCSARRLCDGTAVAVKAVDCRFLFDDASEVLKLYRELVALRHLRDTGVVVAYEGSFLNTSDQILYIITEKMDCSLLQVRGPCYSLISCRFVSPT